MKRIFTAGLFALTVGIAAYLYAATWQIVGWTGSGSRSNTTEFVIESASPGAVAYLRPGAANTNDIGTSTYYLNEVFSRSFNFGVSVDTTTASPDFAGQLVIASDFTVWIGTDTSGTNWVKVGSQ